jgi:hypothetical protein
MAEKRSRENILMRLSVKISEIVSGKKTNSLYLASIQTPVLNFLNLSEHVKKVYSDIFYRPSKSIYLVKKGVNVVSGPESSAYRQCCGSTLV